MSKPITTKRMMNFVPGHHEEQGVRFGMSEVAWKELKKVYAPGFDPDVEAALEAISRNFFTNIPAQEIKELMELKEETDMPSWTYTPGGVDLRLVPFVHEGVKCIGVVHNRELSSQEAIDGQNLFQGLHK